MVHRISGAKNHDSKKSWEDEARILRKDIFALEAQKHQALVFTAHHADDQAETMLWRLFTGAAHTHGGGVAFHHKNEVRPLLRVRKAQIKNYLKEVGQDYREDSTNQSATFLRARMRSELMPQLERIFPRAVDQLVKLALSAQLESGSLGDTPNAPYDILFKAAGLKPRRPHFEILSQKLVANKSWCGEVHLPGGWILKRLSPDKWILERT
jgi:tRNA(Ile)-lysidine synthase